MGELFKVALAYDAAERGAPASVVVKLPSPYDSNRAQGVSLGMYEAQIRFYNELAVGTLTRTPKAYFADIVIGRPHSRMMEDLGDLTMADQIEGMTAPQAERATLALADLHAGWWGKVQTPSSSGYRASSTSASMPWPACGPTCGRASRPVRRPAT